MENEKIKKALECCTRGRKSKDDRPCLDCPYNECNLVGGTSERQTTGTCQGWLMKDALALINSQEQRIKELTDEAANWRIDAENYRNELAEVREETKKLKQDYDCMHSAYCELRDECYMLTVENERLRANQNNVVTEEVEKK